MMFLVLHVQSAGSVLSKCAIEMPVPKAVSMPVDIQICQKFLCLLGARAYHFPLNFVIHGICWCYCMSCNRNIRSSKIGVTEPDRAIKPSG